MALLFASCRKNDITPEIFNYTMDIPGNFPAPPDMTDNPLTAKGVALGRILFYDKRLSGNNQLSCASCHRQGIAFTDAVALNNIGVSGKQLTRSAPALMNLAWMNNGLFWDGGSTNLESQAFGPLTSEDEMHQNLAELVYELNQVPAYIQLFRDAFQDEIKVAYIARALAQFQRTLISGYSRYDRYTRKEPGGYLDQEELYGLKLVNTHCRSCHTGELFTDNAYHNNGLDSDFTNDILDGIYQGRFRVTYNTEDLGKFKTPTLRNVVLTAPYMHDGRISDLKGVLRHYSHGIKASPTIDSTLLKAGTKGLALSEEEQAAIISFLKTLTDSSFINNKNHGVPDIP